MAVYCFDSFLYFFLRVKGAIDVCFRFGISLAIVPISTRFAAGPR